MARRARIPNPLAEIARSGANRYVKSAGERKEEIREKMNADLQRQLTQKSKSNGKTYETAKPFTWSSSTWW